MVARRDQRTQRAGTRPYVISLYPTLPPGLKGGGRQVVWRAQPRWRFAGRSVQADRFTADAHHPVRPHRFDT